MTVLSVTFVSDHGSVSGGRLGSDLRSSRRKARTGFEDFGDCLAREFLPVIQRLLRRYPRRTLRAIERQVAGKVHTPPFRRMSRDERFIFRLWELYGEVKASRDQLSDSAAYLRRFAPPAKRITEDRYVRYHLEAAYNEVYLLQNRLDTLATFLSRSYRHSLPEGVVPKVVSVFPEFVRTTLRPIVSMRAVHVHEHRLDDTELRRLELHERVLRSNPEFRPIVRRVTRRIRLDTSRTVEDFGLSVDVVINVCFGILKVVMFTPEKRLIYPPVPGPAA